MARFGFLLNLLSIWGKIRQLRSCTVAPILVEKTENCAAWLASELAENDATAATYEIGDLRAVNQTAALSDNCFRGGAARSPRSGRWLRHASLGLG